MCGSPTDLEEIVASHFEGWAGMTFMPSDADNAACAITAAFLTALAAAGRLLPTGGSERIEWTEACGGSHQNCYPYGPYDSPDGHDVPPTHTRSVRFWPDGTELVGPWVAVDEGSGTA
jgi:hypothetical protein